MSDLSITVIVVTKNEAANIKRCLDALSAFDDIIVVDSNSDDGTKDIAEQCGADVINFNWNRHYPKKRQWCLDNLNIKNDFVFWVDADEVVPPSLVDDLRTLDLSKAGYFVKGSNVVDGKVLKFGLKNNKLALFNRHKIEFSIVDDLDIDGMGEIEGHYQPVLKKGYKGEAIGQLKTPLHHYAFEDRQRWKERHKRYAAWERAMTKRGAYPKDPAKHRQMAKALFRIFPFRGAFIFILAYLIKGGILDGYQGFQCAWCKAQYYNM